MNEYASVINAARLDVDAAVAADATYWERLAVGQDSEECEHSGFLEGYSQALAACADLLQGNPRTLADYALEARKGAEEQLAELDPPPLDAAEAVAQIAAHLTGREWGAADLEEVAAIVRSAGHEIAEPDFTA